jgi:hypothetical protein
VTELVVGLQNEGVRPKTQGVCDSLLIKLGGQSGLGILIEFLLRYAAARKGIGGQVDDKRPFVGEPRELEVVQDRAQAVPER